MVSLGDHRKACEMRRTLPFLFSALLAAACASSRIETALPSHTDTPFPSKVPSSGSLLTPAAATEEVRLDDGYYRVQLWDVGTGKFLHTFERVMIDDCGGAGRRSDSCCCYTNCLSSNGIAACGRWPVDGRYSWPANNHPTGIKNCALMKHRPADHATGRLGLAVL
jgi:hypothetical protein